MKENILLEKAADYSTDVIKLCESIHENYINKIFIDQLVRSSTSITANLAESVFASTRKTFAYRIQVSLQEANESKYWLILMRRTSHINEKDYNKLLAQCEEIIKMLIASVRTLKK